MNDFIKPNTFKVIFALAIILVWFLGPILHGRIAANFMPSTEMSNIALNTLNFVNYTTDIIFYPVKLISNFFVPKSFILNSLSTDIHKYILLLSGLIYLALVITEAYLISCVIFRLYLMLKRK